MSTKSFRRQTQIAFDVNVKVNNTDTAGNIVTDDIILYYADSLILDIAMGLFGDKVNYPRLYQETEYLSINDNNITPPYTKDLKILYGANSTTEQIQNLKNYVNSLKNYQNYKNVIKCSPFFRKTPMVNKHILGQESTCVQEPIKYQFYNESDVLINEKDWRNIVYGNILGGRDFIFNKASLYNICSISSTYSNNDTNYQLPYRYGDGKKYHEMKSSFNDKDGHASIAKAFGFEIAYQLRRMSEKEYKELVDVWLGKVKTTCYEDVKTRVDGEYVGGLDLDFSEFVAQRPY